MRKDIAGYVTLGWTIIKCHYCLLLKVDKMTTTKISIICSDKYFQKWDLDQVLSLYFFFQIVLCWQLQLFHHSFAKKQANKKIQSYEP